MGKDDTKDGILKTAELIDNLPNSVKVVVSGGIQTGRSIMSVSRGLNKATVIKDQIFYDDVIRHIILPDYHEMTDDELLGHYVEPQPSWKLGQRPPSKGPEYGPRRKRGKGKYHRS